MTVSVEMVRCEGRHCKNMLTLAEVAENAECQECQDDSEEEGRSYDDYEDRSEFADPFGTSALRAESATNPRNLPCPTCGEPNRLTPKDRDHGYQCDSCADRAEGMGCDGDY
jgi:hypothetical protein